MAYILKINKLRPRDPVFQEQTFHPVGRVKTRLRGQGRPGMIHPLLPVEKVVIFLLKKNCNKTSSLNEYIK